MIVQSASHTLEMRREEINVTSSCRPDTRWQYTDSEGHLHCWYKQAESGALVPAGEYDPAKEYSAPTLRYVIDVGETDEYPEEGHYVCVQCGEGVRIGYTADDVERYIAGPITYYCDGKPISREEFSTLAADNVQVTLDDWEKSVTGAHAESKGNALTTEEQEIIRNASIRCSLETKQLIAIICKLVKAKWIMPNCAICGASYEAHEEVDELGIRGHRINNPSQPQHGIYHDFTPRPPSEVAS